MQLVAFIASQHLMTSSITTQELKQSPVRGRTARPRTGEESEVSGRIKGL